MRRLRALSCSAIYLFILSSFVLSCVLPPGAFAAPLIDITRPEDGSIVYGESYIDVAYRGEPGNPIVAIQLFLDGQKIKEWRLTTPQQYGKQSFPWNFALTTGETHVLSACAIDAQGQKGNATITVRVQKTATGGGKADRLPPVIRIYYPAHGAKVSGIQRIKADGEDDTGITTVFFYVDGKFKSMIMNAPPYVYDWDTTKCADGPHVLKVAAFDAAENRGESAEVTVFVENKSLTTEGAGIPTIEPALGAPRGAELGLDADALPLEAPRAQSFREPPESGIPTLSAPEFPAPASAPRLAEPGRTPATPIIRPPAPPRVGTPPAVPGMSRPSGPVLQASTPPSLARSGPSLALVTPPGADLAPSGMHTPAAPQVLSTGSAQLVPDLGSMTSAAASLRPAAPQVGPRTGLPSGSARLAPPAVTPQVALTGMTPPVLTPPRSAGSLGGVGVATTPLVAEGVYQVAYGRPVLTVSPARNAEPPSQATWAGLQRPAPPSTGLAPQAAPALTSGSPQRLTTASLTAPASRPTPPRLNAPPTTTAASPRVAMSPGVGRPPLGTEPNEPRSLVASSVPVAIAHIRNIQVVFKGQRLNLRALPEVAKGVPVAALREIFEHTNGVLYWFPQEKKVRAVNEQVDVSLRIGDPQVQVNAETKTLELAPYIKRGRTMVPLQFIADTLNVTITFNPDTGQIVISSTEF